MDIVEQYRTHGYAVLENAVPEKCRASGTAEALRAKLRERYKTSIEDYLARVRLMAKQPGLVGMFLSEPIRQAVTSLGLKTPVMLTNPAVHIMAEDLKIPGGYEGIGAHQDWPALQSSLNAVVVWLPMWDVGEENYPLEVVPGSHLLGLLPCKAGLHYSELDDRGLEYKPVPVKRGDALIFSVFTVHRTRMPGKGFRLAFSHRYEDADEPTFIEHGYHSAQRRVIDRDLKWTPTQQEVWRQFVTAGAPQ